MEYGTCIDETISMSLSLMVMASIKDAPFENVILSSLHFDSFNWKPSIFGCITN